MRDVEAKHQQFSVTAGCSPGGILPDQAEYGWLELCRDRFSSGLAYFGFQSPLGAKCSKMPVHDGFGCHQQQGILPPDLFSGSRVCRRNRRRTIAPKKSEMRRNMGSSLEQRGAPHYYKSAPRSSSLGSMMTSTSQSFSSCQYGSELSS